MIRLLYLLARPVSRIQGRNNTEPPGERSLSGVARILTPRGVREAITATMARFALRLYDQDTGEAWTANELLDRASRPTLVLDASPVFAGAIPDVIRVSGITDPVLGVDSLVFTRIDDVGDKPAWLAVGAGDNWFVEYDSGAWIIYTSGYAASKTSAADSPVGLTSWTVTVGVGQPVVIAVGTRGDVGQLAIVSGADVYVCVAPDVWSGPLTTAP